MKNEGVVQALRKYSDLREQVQYLRIIQNNVHWTFVLEVEGVCVGPGDFENLS